MIRAVQVDKFIEVYARELESAVIAHSDEYGFSLVDLERVVERMRNAFYEGTYNHDGRAIRRTCRVLGIKHTKTALEEFFNANPEATPA